ncbi:MAG: hypothetical protein AAGC67_15255 [Myxococcota bacterium]
MHPPIPTLRSGSSDRSRSRVSTLAVTMLGSTALVAPTQACMVIEPDASADVSIDLTSGPDQLVRLNVFEERDEEGTVIDRDCYASVQIPLSSFPSISNRLDTRAIAAAIQESAAALGATSCDVTVSYEDPRNDLEMAEECVTATFGFSSSDFWNESAEASCWTDEELAEIEQWREALAAEEAAREAADADAFAAAEDEIRTEEALEEWGESLDDDAALAASEDVVRASDAEPEIEVLWAGP